MLSKNQARTGHGHEKPPAPLPAVKLRMLFALPVKILGQRHYVGHVLRDFVNLFRAFFVDMTVEPRLDLA